VASHEAGPHIEAEKRGIMSNWYGAARSNYVAIKDMEGLKKSLDPFPISIIPRESDGKICLLSDDIDNGGWPTCACGTDASGEDMEILFNPPELICPFMKNGEILIIMEAGAEKLRYISGTAVAFKHTGESVSIFLDDIYQKAANEFGVPIDTINLCQY
jgi:hypothetical protein